MSFIDKILDKMSLNSEDDEEFDNEDYYLDDEEEEYGISLYDHIALDGKSVKENQTITK